MNDAYVGSSLAIPEPSPSTERRRAGWNRIKGWAMPFASLGPSMAAQRRAKVSFLEGKKMPRRVRVKFSAPSSKGAKRVSFLEGKKAPRRTRVSFMAKRATAARGR
jgi:hypothetical protein